MSPSRRRPRPPEEDEVAARAPDSHHVGASISAYLDGRGLHPLRDFGLVLTAWNETLGAQAAAHCRPRRIQGDELLVDVDHPAWSTELAFRAESLLSELSTRLETGAPRRLKVRVVPDFGVE